MFFTRVPLCVRGREMKQKSVLNQQFESPLDDNYLFGLSSAKSDPIELGEIFMEALEKGQKCSPKHTQMHA